VRCFVVAGFLLTSASRGPSAIAEPLVYLVLTGPDTECLLIEANVLPTIKQKQ